MATQFGNIQVTSLIMQPGDPVTSADGNTQLQVNNGGTASIVVNSTSKTVATTDLIADDWVQSLAYAKGAYVIKDGVLYKARIDLAANTAWNASNWEVAKIAKDVAAEKSDIRTILAGMPANLDTYDNALQAINVLWNAVYKLAYGTNRTGEVGSGGGSGPGKE